MPINTGLWIDHREAVIVVLSDDGETTTRILSSVEKQLRRSGGLSEGKHKVHQAPADDSRENAFMGHLSRYYDEIVAFVREAGSLLIIGPGEAKEELRKRFDAHRRDARLITVETAGQMTEPQVVARVRRHFADDSPRREPK
jgi:hypothetical protein